MSRVGIVFTKMHGLGNNYIYIDCWKTPLAEEELPSLAIEASNVNTGIGSDGLILISPSHIADVKMRIFNKDGSEGNNCGNGLRCVAKYAFEKGYAHSKQMSIETKSGIINATILSYNSHTAQVLVDMGNPLLARHEIPMTGNNTPKIIAEPFIIDGKILHLTAVSMGNPHAVFFVPTIDQSPHLILGPKIEKDPRFPEGVNVEFIAVRNPTTIDFRVWERGSGATQACGTGACAAVVAAILNRHCNRDEMITVHLPGGDLQIEWTSRGNVLMSGPATTIATGSFFTREISLRVPEKAVCF